MWQPKQDDYAQEGEEKQAKQADHRETERDREPADDAEVATRDTLAGTEAGRPWNGQPPMIIHPMTPTIQMTPVSPIAATSSVMRQLLD